MNAEQDRNEFKAFFSRATQFASPYEWQIDVAINGFRDVLPVPTGLGKTEGVTLAWAWRRLVKGLPEPMHLVYCLPMRTLVRQTLDRLKRYLRALQESAALSDDVGVYQLMGGAIEEDWAEYPDRPWILVGTQDQLLSRALNRGYSMSRHRWPIDFGLLNQDCLWVVDETQLMGPGLWATSQLDWMRRKRFETIKPSRTVWMSATLGSRFLATTDRKRDGFDKPTALDPQLDRDQNHELRLRCDAVRMAEWLKPSSGRGLDTWIASGAHKDHKPGTLTLIVCNTVEAAQQIFVALPSAPPKLLLTSRFRRLDREPSEAFLLNFEARRAREAVQKPEGNGTLNNDPGLIVVSTQVVEAGVDISAHRLWSELAPWPSVIQRLGRLNRDGRDSEARARFWKPRKAEPRKSGSEDRIGPYLKSDLDKAEKLFDALSAVSARMSSRAAMEQVKNTHEELLEQCLESPLSPLPRALDVHGLFSTERDIYGGFTDVSRFVRNADPDADLTVFWRRWPGAAPPAGDDLDGPPFEPEEGCSVPFHRLRDSLERRKAKAFLWNDERGTWDACRLADLRPGMLVLIHHDAGGYSEELGWTGDPNDRLLDVPQAGRGRSLRDDENTESGYWATLETHLRDTRAQAENLCDALGLTDSGRSTGQLRTAVVEAAALHDLGKAHPNWQKALPAAIDGKVWAKCPRVLKVDAKLSDQHIGNLVEELAPGSYRLPDTLKGNGVLLRWALERKLNRDALRQLKVLPQVRWAGHAPMRSGLRHEAASALAMWRRYREFAPYPALAVYLAAAHHGKVRTVLRTITDSANDVFGVTQDLGALHLDGQSWALDFSVAADGAAGEWRGDQFLLTNHGWTGLIADLLGPWRQDDCSDAGTVPHDEPRRLGPFNLAYLEALVCVADWRASASPSKSFKPSEIAVNA